MQMILRLTEHTSDWWMRSGMEYPFLLGYFLFAAFLLGSCLGSFLNVCIWRMPLGESIADAPSHCTSCGHDIRWFDNLPIVSYLVLCGRCRYCHTHYSCRYLIVEALTGALFALAFLKTGLSEQPLPTILVYFGMIMLVITTCWIDVEHRLIPDATTYPALILGVAAAFAFPAIWGSSNRFAAGATAIACAGGTALFLGLFALLGRKIARHDVLGWGDVKFMAATAALLGLPGAIFTLLAGSLVGSGYGIGLALVRKKPLSRVAIPFGPFLAGAALLWIYAGEKLLRMYLSLMNVPL